VAIAIFFLGHWWSSVFFQTFFLHRYGAHRQFTMSKGMERVFHLMTYVSQGARYLSPRGYAILHRMHHAYSDTPKDPHSPLNHKDVFTMMWATKKRYDAYTYRKEMPEARFDGGFPDWALLDVLGSSWIMRVLWGAGYVGFYLAFATSPWMFLLLPAHFLMGPIHGALVNWCGHKYGYRNFDSDDVSRNTLVFDFLTPGELFQNNHHKFGMSPNFAVRWFEVDPTYHVMRVLAALKLIDMAGAQKTRWEPSMAKKAEPAAAEAEAPAAAEPVGGE